MRINTYKCTKPIWGSDRKDDLFGLSVMIDSDGKQAEIKPLAYSGKLKNRFFKGVPDAKYMVPN